MTRRIVSRVPTTAAEIAQRAMQKFVGPTNGKPKKRASAGSLRKAHIAEVRLHMKAKKWDSMSPSKLVALYWICHEMVYEVVPVELDKVTVWTNATLQAGRMVKTHFDNDIGMAIRFMRWAWTEEQRKEKWRRENQRGGKRLTWQGQFIYDSLVTEWRSEVMRQRGG